ncbi:MAG: apolipoprotein N-acyltransferase [Candidatus Aminicenantes bacterium]|nr:MAG: apolipoprotein N-acyltransferase [Candidatus Aminicenantes bacterium]
MISAFSALLYAFSFPKFSISFFGFFFLVPLLYLSDREKTQEKQRKQRGFLPFFIFAFISYLIILYWIPRVMVRYGDMSRPLSILGILLVAAFLSLFHGIAGMLIKKTALFMVPFIWIGKDLIIEKIFGGFPWCLAGYSQYENIYFIQVAEIGGIHLVTFLLVCINTLFYWLIRNFRSKDIRNRAIAALLVSFIGIYTAGYFLFRVDSQKTSGLSTHQAGIIQPNTNNDPITREEKDRILHRLFTESEELTRRGAEFIVWPEHTVAIYPLQTRTDYDRFDRFVRLNVPLLAGFTDYSSNLVIYNSAILFQKQGIEKYDKVHLTPFGEYVLFREVLFFVKRITDEIADFTPGAAVHNLTLHGHAISTPICYEIIFPGLVRKFVSQGGELVVTISNDSWFGNTSAPYQHLSMAVFRCIENRRYLLRSTTNGISAVVNPGGEILYQSSYNTADRFIGRFKYIKRKTFFTWCGYLFPYFCVVFLVLYLIKSFCGGVQGGQFFQKAPREASGRRRQKQ